MTVHPHINRQNLGDLGFCFVFKDMKCWATWKKTLREIREDSEGTGERRL